MIYTHRLFLYKANWENLCLILYRVPALELFRTIRLNENYKIENFLLKELIIFSKTIKINLFL